MVKPSAEAASSRGDGENGEGLGEAHWSIACCG
jgi:hypothetical protein